MIRTLCNILWIQKKKIEEPLHHKGAPFEIWWFLFLWYVFTVLIITLLQICPFLPKYDIFLCRTGFALGSWTHKQWVFSLIWLMEEAWFMMCVMVFLQFVKCGEGQRRINTLCEQIPTFPTQRWWNNLLLKRRVSFKVICFPVNTFTLHDDNLSSWEESFPHLQNRFLLVWLVCIHWVFVSFFFAGHHLIWNKINWPTKVDHVSTTRLS